MKDPFDATTIDAFGGVPAGTKRPRGRPVSTTKADKARQNRERQKRFKQRQKETKKALEFAASLILLANQGRNRSNRSTLVEFTQYLSGIGEDQDCVVEFEDDNSVKYKFSDLPGLITGNRTIYRIY